MLLKNSLYPLMKFKNANKNQTNKITFPVSYTNFDFFFIFLLINLVFIFFFGLHNEKSKRSYFISKKRELTYFFVKPAGIPKAIERVHMKANEAYPIVFVLIVLDFNA